MDTNLLENDWLKVCYLDDTIKRISLKTAILEAHKIKYIMPVGENKLTTYVIQSFLIDFVQWVYKPIGYNEESSKQAILNLFETGKFDEDAFYQYINYYQNTLKKSFDLFDKEHPFLQISKAEKEELFEKGFLTSENVKYYSFPKFGLERLGGNNSIFEHRKSFISEKDYRKLCKKENTIVPLEQTYELDTEDLVISLLYCLGYSQASGGGSTASVSVAYGSAQHPIFTLIEGNNLFETICLNIGTARNYNCKPIWERDKYFISQNELILENDDSDNSIPLTYIPTVYVQLIDNKKCWLKSINKNDFGAKKNLSELYPVWVSCYPRIVRVPDDNGTICALSYHFDRYFKKVKTKDFPPEIETKLLSLGAYATRCTVLNLNLEVLKPFIKDYSIKFYVCTHRNASETNTLEMSRIMEWPKGKEFPNDDVANAILEIILPYIASIAETTGFYLTVGRAFAIGSCEENVEKKNRYEHFKISGKKVSKLSYDANATVSTAVNECIWILETKEYEKLLNAEEDENTVEDLIKLCTKVFEQKFEDHIRSIRKLSIMKRVELIDFWHRDINIRRKELL